MKGVLLLLAILACLTLPLSAQYGGSSSAFLYAPSGTTATLTLRHNFGTAAHYDVCYVAGTNSYAPASITLGANADTISYSGGFPSNTVCVASIGIPALPIACAGTPGNTVGSYYQFCVTSAGAGYICNNSAGCALAADWVAPGLLNVGSTPITGGTANNLLLSGSTLGQLAITTNDVPVSNSSGVIFSAENMINAQSYGCKPDGGTTDNATCISNMFTYAAAHPGTTIYFPSSGATGRYYNVKTPITVRWPSYTRLLGDSVEQTQIGWAPTSSQGTVPAIFDATGAQNIEMEHLTVNGTTATYPTQVGILLERNGSNGSAGGHHFSYSNIEGYYVVAAVYSISSEGNDWHGTRIQSEATGVPALITSAVDSAGVCVASGSYTCQSGGQSNLSLFFEGGSSAIGLAGDAIVDVVNNGTGDHVYRDSYFSAAGTGSSAIRLENITNVGSQITIEGNREENATYFVRFSSGGGNTYNNVHISNNTGSNSTGYCMYADTGTTVSASVIEGNNCNSATSSFDTLTNSRYLSTTETSVVARTGGSGNVLVSPGVSSVFSGFSTSTNVLMQNGVVNIPSAVLGACTGCGGGSSATVALPSTDLVCANGSDNTINGVAISAATLASSAVLTVPNSGNFFAGTNASNVTISGVNQSGWNGNYQVTSVNYSSNAITINLNSSSLTAISGGTPLLSLTCSNSTDATSSYTAFATTVTTSAGAFSVAGKQLQLDLNMLYFSPGNQTNTVNYFRLYAGSLVIYQSNAKAADQISTNSGTGFGAQFQVTAQAAAGSSVSMATNNYGPFMPGEPAYFWQNTQNFGQPIATNAAITFSAKTGWSQTGAGGTITYSSGGTATGTGNCLATASSGTPAAVGLIGVSSGTISGTLSFGHAAQTTSGGNYTSVPTSWTLTVPTTGGASTCSGTITTTGGSLVGAQGNAIQLFSLTNVFRN